jgi:uncharacterized cysteine cluster protein YcgN (CxxCxxCC family)
MIEKEPFWEVKTLSQMSQKEWDALCDGCAKCCLHKIEDEDNGEVSYTNVVCEQLDINTCRCKNFVERTKLVHDCIELTKDNVDGLKWLPQSCAYRLLSEGKNLYWWHPLISGDVNTVHKEGVSVKGRVVEEKDIYDIEDHIVTWPDEKIL